MACAQSAPPAATPLVAAPAATPTQSPEPTPDIEVISAEHTVASDGLEVMEIVEMTKQLRWSPGEIAAEWGGKHLLRQGEKGLTTGLAETVDTRLA